MSPFFFPVLITWAVSAYGGAVNQRELSAAAPFPLAVERSSPAVPAAPPPVAAQPAPVAPPVTAQPLPRPTPAPAPRVAQAPVDPAMIRAELEMWTRIKDSTRVEEVEAFLAAFPDGRLAGLARMRLDEIRRGDPPPPTVTMNPQNPTALMQPQPAQPAPAIPQPTIRPEPPIASLPPSNEPFFLSRSAIIEAQERLYSLNYYSGPINGNYGSQTREAIRDYQQRQSLPATGEIDGTLMARLRAAKIPDKWGALAFSARGGYGAAWARGTRRQAEADAMAICRRNTRGSCKIVVAPGSACSALAVYEARSRSGRRNWGAFATTRPTRDAARDAAIEYCRGEAIAPDRCEITTLICGDTGQQV